MHASLKHPSFSFYQKMFDFIVIQLRSRFFTGKLTAEQFTNGMLTITDISVKFYDLDTANVVVLCRAEFDILENAYKAMKEDVLSLTPQTELDALMLKSTSDGYDQCFEIWRNHIHVQEPEIIN
jgi:hypothetical protein